MKTELKFKNNRRTVLLAEWKYFCRKKNLITISAMQPNKTEKVNNYF